MAAEGTTTRQGIRLAPQGGLPQAARDQWQARQDARSAQATLKEYGFKQGLGARYTSWIFGVVIAALAIVLGYAVVIGPTIGPANIEILKLAPIVLALVGLASGYQQWRAARREISLDRYYERLNLANARIHEWPSVRALINNREYRTTDDEPFELLAAYQRTMYVHIELDNLEYAIQKYQIGYMAPELALRALHTFRDRCQYSGFRQALEERLDPGNHSDYTDMTTEVVRRVLARTPPRPGPEPPPEWAERGHR